MNNSAANITLFNSVYAQIYFCLHQDIKELMQYALSKEV